jgi:hypothetical protein
MLLPCCSSFPFVVQCVKKGGGWSRRTVEEMILSVLPQNPWSVLRAVLFHFMSLSLFDEVWGAYLRAVPKSSVSDRNDDI